jgi:hypothetical protein
MRLLAWQQPHATSCNTVFEAILSLLHYLSDVQVVLIVREIKKRRITLLGDWCVGGWGNI